MDVDRAGAGSSLGPAMSPKRLGPYRLLETAATRALTVTYRAEHEGLGHRVLIKTLKPTVLVSSPFAQDLDREAKLLARVRHESIVQLFDFVRTDDRVWMVLEDVGGAPLSEVLAAAGRLPVDTAMAIALELARALGHAHERGVVHKGLCPEVIQIAPGGRVKIVDFSRSHDARTPSIPEPFEGSATFGRPDYMSPEQILGEDAGPQADVFALGVLLYELCAGARPFDAPDAKDVALRIRNAEAAPLGQTVPDAPGSLERILIRCLAKLPEDRYEDGRRVAAALEEALAPLTHLSTRVLVSRALAAAKLGEEVPAPAAAAARTPIALDLGRSLVPTARSLALVFVLIVGGGAAIELGLREHDEPAPAGSAAGAPAQGAPRGFLKVLARPWAEVLVDGELVEVTPAARPIPVLAGRHFVTFRHPNAPDEKRTITVAAGQTVLLDVAMRIERPDAGRPPAPDASASP